MRIANIPSPFGKNKDFKVFFRAFLGVLLLPSRIFDSIMNNTGKCLDESVNYSDTRAAASNANTSCVSPRYAHILPPSV